MKTIKAAITVCWRLFHCCCFFPLFTWVEFVSEEDISCILMWDCLEGLGLPKLHHHPAHSSTTLPGGLTSSALVHTHSFFRALLGYHLLSSFLSLFLWIPTAPMPTPNPILGLAIPHWIAHMFSPVVTPSPWKTGDPKGRKSVLFLLPLCLWETFSKCLLTKWIKRIPLDQMSTTPFAPDLVFTVKWLHGPLSALFCPSRSVLCSEPGPLIGGHRAGSQTSRSKVTPSHQRPVPRMRQSFSVSDKMVENTSNHILLELKGV